MNQVRHINIPIFVPHMGCPHACVFCDQKRISGTLNNQTPERAKQILEQSFSGLENSDESLETEIAFFGGSFTAIPEKEMISYLELTKPYILSGKALGIRISTRPDAISHHILDILLDYKVTSIELGVQSLDEEVLQESQRGHGREDVFRAVDLIRQRGISLGIQTMLGLPKDSFEKSFNTAKEVIALRPDMVRVYPAVVLKNTLLEDYYLSGEYRPLSVEEAVQWATKIIPIYREAGINILRIGLQGSDTLEDAIVAGPYHPALGELVESNILYEKLVSQLDVLRLNNSLNYTSSINIISNPRLLSKLVGHKRANIKALKDKYGISKINVISDPTQAEYIIKI